MTANSREDRELIVRDKAAREGFDVPDDVVSYLVERIEDERKLKSELINIAMFAAHRSIPISLAVAKLVVDGERVRPLSTMTPEYEEEMVAEAEAEAKATEEAEKELFQADADFTPEASEEPSLFSYDESDESFEPSDEATQSFPKIADATQEPTKAKEEESSKPLDFGFGPISVTTTASPETTATEDTGRWGAVGSSDVFFIPLRTQRKRSLLERINLALTRTGLDDMILAGEKVAIKVHFGEQGNTGFVSPLYARAVVDRVKQLGAKPFLTDANTLYSGSRSNAIDHLNCAIANGFGYSSVGAPLIIADGLVSRDSVEVPVPGGKHFDTVRIGSAAIDADAMIVISHFKGHEEAGFGGALKNVGMGLGTRSAKQRMHSGIKPKVDFSACTACGRCVDWCPVNCIEMRTGTSGARHAFINRAPCIGCGECLAACAYEAIAINWESSPQDFLEKTVEHAVGALTHLTGKVAYLNFLTNISPDCDCWGFTDAPIVPDIGILASRDAVAIDQASLDLVAQATGATGSRGEDMQSGEDKFHALHSVDAAHTLKYAESLGLGTRSYRLRQVG